MAYHLKQIKKGKIGEFSKIQEEIDELLDAHSQNNSILELVELSDLIGAIELYVENYYKINLDTIIKMTKVTQSSFKDGTRK